MTCNCFGIQENDDRFDNSKCLIMKKAGIQEGKWHETYMGTSPSLIAIPKCARTTALLGRQGCIAEDNQLLPV